MYICMYMHIFYLFMLYQRLTLGSHTYKSSTNKLYPQLFSVSLFLCVLVRVHIYMCVHVGGGWRSTRGAVCDVRAPMQEQKRVMRDWEVKEVARTHRQIRYIKIFSRQRLLGGSCQQAPRHTGGWHTGLRTLIQKQAGEGGDKSSDLWSQGCIYIQSHKNDILSKSNIQYITIYFGVLEHPVTSIYLLTRIGYPNWCHVV